MNIQPQQILIRDYTYDLPPHRIADLPLEKRDGSRLLMYKEGLITEDRFYHLSHHLPPGTTLVLNDTRVIEARVLFQKPTGGVIEIFCLEPYGQSIEEAMQQKERAVWKCMIGGASKWKPGQVLTKAMPGGEVEARYREKKEDHFLIEFAWLPADRPFVQVLHESGSIPLPPYIKRPAGGLDSERYQTVFSRQEGSVAAPTAALHFTPAVFDALAAKNILPHYVTLHVGAGTFKPVKTETIGDHPMHGEPFTVKRTLLQSLIGAQKVVAVGTTSLRTLESLYWLGLKVDDFTSGEPELQQWEAYELEEKKGDVSYRQSLQNLLWWMEKEGLQDLHCRTSLLIAPGYRFRIPHGLITNFHQPQSTLLLLIAAFVGEDWRRIYDHALRNDYRFLSYGDSSLLWRKEEER